MAPWLKPKSQHIATAQREQGRLTNNKAPFRYVLPYLPPWANVSINWELQPFQAWAILDCKIYRIEQKLDPQGFIDLCEVHAPKGFHCGYTLDHKASGDFTLKRGGLPF